MKLTGNKHPSKKNFHHKTDFFRLAPFSDCIAFKTTSQVSKDVLFSSWATKTDNLLHSKSPTKLPNFGVYQLLHNSSAVTEKFCSSHQTQLRLQKTFTYVDQQQELNCWVIHVYRVPLFWSGNSQHRFVKWKIAKVIRHWSANIASACRCRPKCEEKIIIGPCGPPHRVFAWFFHISVAKEWNILVAHVLTYKDRSKKQQQT